MFIKGGKMEVKSSNNNILITGNIKSTTHYHNISAEIESLKDSTKNIKIYIYDSISITSSVIGYLCKLVTTSDIALSLYVEDDSLHSLLNDLNLIDTLNVQKITNR